MFDFTMITTFYAVNVLVLVMLYLISNELIIHASYDKFSILCCIVSILEFYKFVLLNICESFSHFLALETPFSDIKPH